jgi:hypothetical protein
MYSIKQHFLLCYLQSVVEISLQSHRYIFLWLQLMFCFQVVTGGVLKEHVQGAGGSIQFTVQRPHYVSSVLANIMSPPVASRRKSQKADVCMMVCAKFWANYYILIYSHCQELYA